MSEHHTSQETLTANQPAPTISKPEETPVTAATPSVAEMAEPEKPKNKLKFVEYLLTLVAFILSVPIIASIIWLIYMRAYDCEYLLKLRKLYYGIIAGLVIMLLFNNLALFFITRLKLRMLGLILVMISVIAMFLVGLGFVGGYQMESRSMPGSPQRIKMSIYNENNWFRIKSCLYDKSICQVLATRSDMIKSYDYTMKKLSPVQSGCCRPPSSCNMKYVNATYWIKQGSVSSEPYNSDCDAWTNQDTILCYNCNSCKEGFRRTIEKKWIILGWLVVSISILLFIVHLVLFLISMSQSYKG